MRSLNHSLLAALAGGIITATSATAQTVVNFDEFSLSTDSYFQSTPDTPTTFESNGVSFSHTTPSWGGFSDFTYSNRTDTTTEGFSNPASAFTGGGDGDAYYGVGYISGSLSLNFQQSAGVSPLSISLTNTTYAALSMLNGDGFAKKFGGASGNEPDYFTLTITGFDAFDQETGSVDFYLADFRFTNSAEDYVVDEWTTVDLTSLGSGVTELAFSLDSSDTGSFGINTPTYFAFDNLTFTAVPEPATFPLIIGMVGILIAFRRKA